MRSHSGIRRSVEALTGLALAAGLAACQLSGASVNSYAKAAVMAGGELGLSGLNSGGSQSSGTGQASPIVSNNTGGLISNNAGSLMSNNAAALSGSVMAPATLISNNASAYRVAALSTLPLAGALVYLTDTQERIFVDPQTGTTLTTTTDGNGDFFFPKAPATNSVIVDAVMSGNRRMVGFLDSHAGQNDITMTLASTLVTEFLRSRAQQAGPDVTIGSFDPSLQHIPTLVDLTQTALDAGQLSVPDLSVGAIPAMDRNYLVQFGTRSLALKQAWESLLGFHISIVDTLAGGQAGFAGDGLSESAAQFSDPNCLVKAPDGSIFVADTGNNRIRRIAPDGTVSTVAGGGAISEVPARLQAGQITDVVGDGGPATQAIVQEPRGVVPLANGAFAFTEFVGQRLRLVLPDGTIQTLVHGNVNNDGPSDGPLSQANLIYPMGLATGADGSIYICDLGEDVVRKIPPCDPANLLQSGTIQTVAGNYQPGNALTPPPDGAVATQTSLFSPSAIAVDATGDLYIAELEAYRIVEVTPDGKLHPFAGDGVDGATGDGGPATQASIGQPSALVLDPANNRLLIGSWSTPRIRAIDLSTGIITTLAGAGHDPEDGLAEDSALGDIGGMMLDSVGNLLFTEVQTSRLRRLWLTEPPAI